MRALLGPLVKNASWLLAGDFLVKGSLLLISIVVARGLGAEALGVFTVALGAALVAVQVLACGQAEVLIRAVAGAPGQARPLLGAARRLQRRLLAGALPAALAALLLVRDGELRAALAAFAPYVLLRVEVFTRGAVFKGLDRMDVEVKARGLESLLALALVAALALFALAGAGASTWTPPTWSLALALAAGAAAGLAWLLARQRELPPGPEPPGAAAGTASPLRAGLAFAGLGLGLQLLLRGDTFLLAAFAVPRAEIGHYGAAAALVWGLLALPQMTAVALYPTFSRLARGSPSREPTRAAFLAGGLGAGLGLAAGAALWALRGPLVALLFGPEMADASALVGRLAWALPGAGASMVLGVVVAAWHRQERGLALLGLTLAVSLLLNLSWIPRAGAAGAATAAAIAHGLGALGNLVLAVWPEGAGPGSSRGRGDGR